MPFLIALTVLVVALAALLLVASRRLARLGSSDQP